MSSNSLTLELHPERGRKRIQYRYDIEKDVLVVKYPYRLSQKEIARNAAEHAKLLERLKERTLKANRPYLMGEPQNEEPSPETRRKLLEEYLAKRVPEIAREMAVPKSFSVKIGDYKTRYGVCSYERGEVRFSLSLSKCSPKLIDSVIYHEMAHFFVHDHSKKFYDKLLAYCPDYRDCRKALIRSEYSYGKDN